jgi:tRNA(Ile2)-agmatinylcytidine synthase
MIEPNKPAIVKGKIGINPITIKGGHVIFSLSDGSNQIDCAAYEPTGNFRKPIRKLIKGDVVRAYGGAKNKTVNCKITLNLEKLEVLKLNTDKRCINPTCPICSGSMESMGRDKGFRCRKCGFKDSMLKKHIIEIKRELKPGLYIPPLQALRHLTKPLKRYGIEKQEKANIKIYNPWHWP